MQASTSCGGCCHTQKHVLQVQHGAFRGRKVLCAALRNAQQQQQQHTRATATTSGKGTRSSSSRRSSSAATEIVALTEPVSSLDVDRELWAVLDLCSDEELEGIFDVLHGASPFSPVIKSIVREDEPPLLQLRGRTSIMHKVRGSRRRRRAGHRQYNTSCQASCMHACMHTASLAHQQVTHTCDSMPILPHILRHTPASQIEARFRFLAADSTATIRGKRPGYREALLLIRDR